MSDKKTSCFAIYKILEEYSDCNHILSLSEIKKHLKDIYHVTLDRRTIYRNFDMLKDYGFDISTFEDNHRGYYLIDRLFSSGEIFLLCNAIHASNYIPNKASKELIDKLLDTQSKYVKDDFRNQVYVENNNKKENKEFFYTIETISEAIKNKQNISFIYTKYDLNKKLVNRREEPYIISPYYLVYDNDRTYLIGKSKNHNDLTHFRIDRIKSIKINTEDKYIKHNKNEDPYEYAKSKLYMYKGDDSTVALRCSFEVLDEIIDRFGKDITIVKDNEKYFTTYIHTSHNGMKYFASQYMDYVEILEPKALRKEFKEYLNRAVKKYK